MDKERVKQALNKKYELSLSDKVMVSVILDAIELSREMDPVWIGKATQIAVGNLVVCPTCDGRGYMAGYPNTTKTCQSCGGDGSIKVVSNTPSA